MKTRLLVVDDDVSIADALAERFRARGYSVDVAHGPSAAEALLGRRPPDVVLCDLQMPEGDGGLGVLRAIRRLGVEATVVVITAYGTIAGAVEAMREGAWDFVEKPFDPDRIEEVVRRAAAHQALRSENRALRAARSAAVQPMAADPAMQQVLALANKVAGTDSTVLLTGESGTGKEVLAQTIHAASDRADGPMVAVNCAALSDALLESELFGHEKGAFTGADRRRVGRVEIADRGTLFLDEIGDVSPAFQTRLLRVLQEQCFERVGGATTIDVDIRVIAATNKDLEKAVRDGTFREDLYWRLKVFPIAIPSLRERVEDIVPLAAHFAATLDPRRAGSGKVPQIAGDARRALRAYTWPGNVRELRNVIERALVAVRGRDLARRLATRTGDRGFAAEFRVGIRPRRRGRCWVSRAGRRVPARADRGGVVAPRG